MMFEAIINWPYPEQHEGGKASPCVEHMETCGASLEHTFGHKRLKTQTKSPGCSPAYMQIYQIKDAPADS